jgi:squalene-associated FAD-dependent desaturase
MAGVVVIGGGLAGLAAAAALGGAGHRVRVLEARPFLGGRATSYVAGDETIDNCQHILLRCCVNLLDFYHRLGVEHQIEFHKEFHFIEPGGKRSVLSAGMLPAPFHFTGSFLSLSFLTLADKIQIGRAIRAIAAERDLRRLESITMQQWLEEQHQPPGAIGRYWRQILVSAINEELDRMAASHGLQVFKLGFLARKDAYQMGIPAVPLRELYSSSAWTRLGNVEIVLRTPVEKVVVADNRVRGVIAGGEEIMADYYISAIPFERIGGLVPGPAFDAVAFEHSPITGIHLWFDRPVTDLPHATLLDRTIQWMFNKHEGRYIQLVVSASRSLVEMPRAQVIALAQRELAEFFPAASQSELIKAHVVKELRATFSARPGLEAHRPENRTAVRNLFLAGDWTRTGWPATMEGAVRSGYLAAESITKEAGAPQRFLLPDIA